MPLPMRRALVVALAAAALSAAAIPARTGGASDFWDEVRAPGVAAHRAATARAETAYRARRFGEVETHAREALARRDDGPLAHALLALALGAVGRNAEAVPHLARARALDPAIFDEPARGVEAVRIAVRAEELRLAADLLARLVGTMRVDPNRRALFTDHGDVLLALGPESLEASVRAYQAALRDARGHEPRASLGLALALHRSGREAEAAALAAEVAATSRVESILAAVAAPAAERKARLALVQEAGGQYDAARDAWALAAQRAEWADHAHAQVARLENASARGRRP